MDVVIHDTICYVHWSPMCDESTVDTRVRIDPFSYVRYASSISYGSAVAQANVMRAVRRSDGRPGTLNPIISKQVK